MREKEREKAHMCIFVLLCFFVFCFVFWLWAIIMQMATEWIIIWRFAEFVFCPRHWILAGVWSLFFLWDWILAGVWSLSFLWDWILAGVGQTCHGYCGMVVSFAEFMSASSRSVHWFCCTWKRYHYQHIGSTALERGTAVSSLVLLDLKKVLLSAHWFYCTSKRYHCQCIVVLHFREVPLSVHWFYCPSERFHCQCIDSTALRRGTAVSVTQWNEESLWLNWGALNWMLHASVTEPVYVCFSDAQKYLLYADSVYIY